MIPPDTSAAFVADMEEVLEVYQRPHDPCDSVRRAFSGIGAMIRAAQIHAKPMSREHINRQTRWPECGRPASPVKAGLRPPPSAAKGLDRTRCPAFVGHQAFDGGVRLMREPTTLPPSRKPLTQKI